jgi:hypothetical protein
MNKKSVFGLTISIARKFNFFDEFIMNINKVNIHYVLVVLVVFGSGGAPLVFFRGERDDRRQRLVLGLFIRQVVNLIK